MSGPAPEHRDVGFERKDVNERSAFWFGVGILAVMVAVAFLVKPLYEMLAAGEAATQRPAAYVPPTEPQALVPPSPHLQVNPGNDLAALRSREDAVLGGYAWVDKERGVARIPITQAMRLVAERGLPAFPATPPAGESSR